MYSIYVIRNLRSHYPLRSLAIRSTCFFSNSSTSTRQNINPLARLEEETFSDYEAGQFYPVHIEEIIRSPLSAYEILGKLGYGRNSTVWLCQESSNSFLCTLKVRTTHIKRDNQEAKVYSHLSLTRKSHPGHQYVRTLREAFVLRGPDGLHHCLVHPPLGMNLSEFQDTFPDKRLPQDLVKGLVVCLLQALDYLHTVANVIHTDIQARNVFISLADETPLLNFAKAERETPSFRKVVDERRTIYTTRALDFSIGNPMLGDFGLSVFGEEHEGEIQPMPFRAPEVILRMKWDSKVDIWNLGVLIWDLLFNKHLFDGETEQDQLARMIAYLGPPHSDFLRRSKLSTEYFDENGNWKRGFVSPSPLEDILEGEEIESFIDLIRSMVAWLPEERKTAAELLEHPWLNYAKGEGKETEKQ